MGNGASTRATVVCAEHVTANPRRNSGRKKAAREVFIFFPSLPWEGPNEDECCIERELFSSYLPSFQRVTVACDFAGFGERKE
jgi:hypothetical protein